MFSARTNDDGAKYQIWYHCYLCGHGFKFGQDDVYRDPEVKYCWDCIDMLFYANPSSLIGSDAGSWPQKLRFESLDGCLGGK